MRTSGDTRPTRRAGALVAGLALAAGLAACGDDTSEGAEPEATAPEETTTAPGSPELPREGDIAAGTYEVPASASSAFAFSITFPEGWIVQYGHVYSKHEDEDEEISLQPVVIDTIYTDSCADGAGLQEVEPGDEALVAAILGQPGAEVVGDPVQTTVGDHLATRIDLVVPEGLDLQTCRLAQDGVEGLQLWHSEAAGKYFVLLPGATASVFIVDVDGGRPQVFATQYRAGTSSQDVEELIDIIDSIRIDVPR